ncbi:MAG: putative toxin-antitoxin system toxin component, PIN family [Roseateles depolymerans]|uniref:Putative toxin-antitoxin system toxin component, PIN family n=1 Tax=Roseateles depolymerans TaxID=76731 RepID=A0A2W5F727_9BURK|nr:MAG: putative toxin-antitoxin system toxin component, PIN family [Roseateles depolymerans]
MSAEHDTPCLPRIVIDTQVLMDWMVFHDARVAGLVEAVTSRRVDWLVTEAMLDEIRHVLQRGVAAAYNPDIQAVKAHFQAHARPCPPASVSPRLVCRDKDDQKFIDLALEQQARWLVSRDKAVLALARRARERGLHIVKPEQWTID